MASAEEQRVRRNLRKYGFRLVKSVRRADLTIDDQGGYGVQRVATGHFVCPGNFGLTLENAMACVVLARRGEFDTSCVDHLEFDQTALDKLLGGAVGGRIRGRWKNEVTLRSVEMFTEYEPGSYVRFISPTPLLMVVALGDVRAVPDLALAAYERALAPKRLVNLAGGHFDAYVADFEAASKAAVEWFTQHLAPE